MLAVGAVLAQGASPPPGWELAPAATIPRGWSNAPSACCATDATCCERQFLIDRPIDLRPGEPVTFLAADLPEAVVRTSPAPGPGIEGAPALRLVDGRGQPPPWKDGPYSQLRVMPPGVFGDLWRERDAEPFFEPPELRGQGYGVIHSVGANGAAPFVAGPYRFHALSPGPNGTVAWDYLEGELDASLRSTVRTWVHADTRALVRDVVFAFRRADETGETVHLVLPEVILGSMTAGVQLQGGFDSSSRFSRSWAFTEYAIPASPGAAGMATFVVTDTQVRTLRALGVKPRADRGIAVTADVSRTSSEPTARVRLRVEEVDDP
jgi:hypothetical protein